MTGRSLLALVAGPPVTRLAAAEEAAVAAGARLVAALAELGWAGPSGRSVLSRHDSAFLAAGPSSKLPCNRQRQAGGGTAAGGASPAQGSHAAPAGSLVTLRGQHLARPSPASFWRSPAVSLHSLAAAAAPTAAAAAGGAAAASSHRQVGADPWRAASSLTPVLTPG